MAEAVFLVIDIDLDRVGAANGGVGIRVRLGTGLWTLPRPSDSASLFLSVPKISAAGGKKFAALYDVNDLYSSNLGLKRGAL